MNMDVYTELFNRDRQASLLIQQNRDMSSQNECLKKTIETLVRVKCKRGESNVHLNTELFECLVANKKTLTLVKIEELSNTHKKENDIVIHLILDLLVGEDRQQTPCVLLDPYTVLYKRGDTYNASNVLEFAMIVHELIQDQLSILVSEFTNADNTTINVTFIIGVMNLMMQESSFVECFRKALKKYTTI